MFTSAILARLELSPSQFVLCILECPLDKVASGAPLRVALNWRLYWSVPISVKQYRRGSFSLRMTSHSTPVFAVVFRLSAAACTLKNAKSAESSPRSL